MGVVVVIVSLSREKTEVEKKNTLQQNHALRCFAQRGHYLLSSESGCCCHWRCWRESWNGATGGNDDGGGGGGRRQDGGGGKREEWT